VLDATYERGANLDASAAVKASTSLPVLVAGRIARPSEAEDALASGKADMIGVVRALIADPGWLAKGEAGDDDAIRPCTFCNECVAGIGVFRPIRCTVNPDMGHEREVATAGWNRRAKARRRVVVVGGGLGGMEASLTACRRGHEVVLLEAGAELGGQLRLAPALGIRRELVHLPGYLAGAVAAAGIEVRLGVEGDAGTVLGLEPDAVIVATGSIPAPPAGLECAVNAVSVLDGSAAVGRRVVVCHDGGHPWEFDAVLEHLVAHGHEVVAVVAAPVLMGRGTDAGLLYRLARARVRVESSSAVVTFGQGCLELREVLTGVTRTEEGFDSLVVATTRVASTSLAAALRGRVADLLVVGDSLAPRSVRDAVSEGRAAGRRIGD
jgi:hypothetical protein